MQPPVTKTGSDVNLSKPPAHVSKIPAKLSLVFGILYVYLPLAYFLECDIPPKYYLRLEYCLPPKYFLEYLLYTSKVVGLLYTSKVVGMVTS